MGGDGVVRSRGFSSTFPPIPTELPLVGVGVGGRKPSTGETSAAFSGKITDLMFSQFSEQRSISGLSQLAPSGSLRWLWISLCWNVRAFALFPSVLCPRHASRLDIARPGNFGGIT